MGAIQHSGPRRMKLSLKLALCSARRLPGGAQVRATLYGAGRWGKVIDASTLSCNTSCHILTVINHGVDHLLRML